MKKNRIFLCLVLVWLLTWPAQSFSRSTGNVKTDKSLYAMVDPSDSGSSVTLKDADKKASATENKRKYFYPLYFSPLIIAFIAIAVKKRKSKKSGK